MNIIALIPLSVCRLLGIPVAYSCLFSEPMKWAEHRGAVLEGDPGMPPTMISWLPSLINKARNAILAKFVWQTYTVLYIGSWVGDYHVAFRSDMSREDGSEAAWNWAVMPQRITTRFVAVKNGKESCEFAVFRADDGAPMGFDVIARGSKKKIEAAVRDRANIAAPFNRLDCGVLTEIDPIWSHLTFV